MKGETKTDNCCVLTLIGWGTVWLLPKQKEVDTCYCSHAVANPCLCNHAYVAVLLQLCFGGALSVDPCFCNPCCPPFCCPILPSWGYNLQVLLLKFCQFVKIVFLAQAFHVVLRSFPCQLTPSLSRWSTSLLVVLQTWEGTMTGISFLIHATSFIVILSLKFWVDSSKLVPWMILDRALTIW